MGEIEARAIPRPRATSPGTSEDDLVASRPRRPAEGPRWPRPRAVVAAALVAAVVAVGAGALASSVRAGTEATGLALGLGSGDDEGGEGPGGSAPLLQATAGAGPGAGATAGDRCIGVVLDKTTVGCTPALHPRDVTATVESRLVPGL